MKSPTSLLTLIASLSAFTVTHHSAAEVDSTFAAEINGTVHALVVDAAGQILVGGEFSQVNDAPRQNLARLAADGALDKSFAVATDGAVLALASDAQGSIYLGGAFDSPSRHLARLSASGALIPLSLGASTSSRIDCLAVGPDGSATIGGPFRRLDGGAAVYVAKVTLAGEIDSNFSSCLLPNMAIEAGADAIALQADGKVILGGNVSTGGGFACLVRLNADGSLDSTFSGDHGPILYTKSIVVLENGQILIAGVANSSGEGFVRRLNADGSVDASFAAPMFDDSVEAIAHDLDGKILVGGNFSGGLNRLNGDGSIDPSWDISTDGVVKTIALHGDDVLVGGAFQQVGNSAHSGLARIHLQKGTRLIATNANGRFLARIQGEAGKTYAIEASSDLNTWSPFGTATGSAAGIEINDNTSGARGHRFFRARLLD